MIERNLALQIEAIEYEHWMLLETSRIMTMQWLQFDRVTANAFVEAHAIHLRNLIEFLFDKPTRCGCEPPTSLQDGDLTDPSCWDARSAEPRSRSRTLESSA
jgi:hypothetical protein